MSEELIELEAGILTGVTKPTIDKIREADITTVQALARQTPKEFSEKAGMGEDTARKAIEKARALVDEGFITATQLEKNREGRTRLLTGSWQLDALIGGGVESETTMELAGAFASGKTQICHMLAVNAQLPVEQGGLGGAVAWIDTEDTFRPERIREICRNRGYDEDTFLEGIWHAQAMNSQHQKNLIQKLYAIVPENNIKLIIVDSMLGHLRAEYIGRGMLGSRQDLLKQFTQHVLKVALSTKTTVVYTNQVMDNPGIMYGNPEKPTGGHIMGHAAGTRLWLRKGRNNVRIAKLIDSLSLPEGEAPFRITEKGIEETEEKPVEVEEDAETG